MNSPKTTNADVGRSAIDGEHGTAQASDISALLLAGDDTRPVHFTGIAGAGMSALAELLAHRGVPVQGSDSNPNGAPDLVALGIVVSAHDASRVAAARALVYSSAIAATHPEMEAARAAGIPVIRRAEALAAAVAGGTLVGIAGTHGKTTTTVLTAAALASAGRNPTAVVGGRVREWKGNLRLGGSTAVVEADEYDRSFLALYPEVAVVLNVEADHLDIYENLSDILQAFGVFASRATTVVVCADDVGAGKLRLTGSHNVIGYTANTAEAAATHAQLNARLRAENIVLGREGSHFTVNFDAVTLGEVTLSIPGLHNVRNALAAIGVGLTLGCTLTAMTPGLEGFHGVERRFQRIATVSGIDIVDDYAHHPTEIQATIAAARQAFPGRRLIIAFQPHLYSRTRDLHREFGEALAAADGVLLCDIYPAREAPIPGVSSSLIGQHIAGKLLWQGAREEVAAALYSAVRSGDAVLTMGAGDITRVGPDLAALLSHEAR